MKILSIFITLTGAMTSFVGTLMKNEAMQTYRYATNGKKTGIWGRVPSAEDALAEVNIAETVITIGFVILIVGFVMLITNFIPSNSKKQITDNYCSIKCLKCGNIVPETQNFCNCCGNNLYEQKNIQT